MKKIVWPYLFGILVLVVVPLSACVNNGSVATDAPASATTTSIPQSTDTPVPTDTPMPTPTKTATPTPNPFEKGSGAFASGDGNAAVSLKIINNSDKALLVNWINFSGGAEPFTEVGAESSISVDTYSTHAWQVVDKAGNVISEFKATKDKQQVFEIEPDLQVVYQPTPLPAPTYGPEVPTTERAYADRPDDYPDQYQFHILYVIPKGAKDRQIDLNGVIAKTVEAENKWFSEQSGGSTIRFDTYQGQLDITFVELEITNKEFLENTLNMLGSNNFNRDYLEQTLERMRIFHPGKIYVAFFDVGSAPNACADASHFPDLPGRLAGLYAIANSTGYSCANDPYGVGVTAGDMTMFHEVLHTLGFASQCGKNPTSAENTSHTGDDVRDIMWAPAEGYNGPWWDTDHMLLDPGNDDYFNHNIPNCPDLAQSAFLDPLPENAQLPQDWPDEWKLP